jgi:hypothetical protein
MPPSVSSSGNKTHDAAVLVAEATRQNAVRAATTTAAARAAEIIYFRTCLASAVATGVMTEAYVNALKELGTGGA